MAGSVKQAKTRDYAKRNWLLFIALVAAVLGPFLVRGSRTVVAVENAWEEFGEVMLAETQRWRYTFNRRSALSLPGGMLCHHLSRQLNSEMFLPSASAMRCLCLH